MKHRNILTAITVIIILNIIYYLFGNLRYIFNVGLAAFNFSFMLGLATQLLTIVGLIIFISSNFTKSSLIRLHMCLHVIFFPLSVWYYYRLFNGMIHYGSFVPPIDYMTYVNLCITIISITASSIGLFILSKQQKPLYNYVTIANESIAEFSTTSSEKRIVNWCIDLLMIALLTYRFAESNNNTSQFFDDSNASTLVTYVMLILYFLLLEGVFKTSAGKCITNTIIVKADGNPASLAQLIGRTFCRLIPFDGISFLARSKRGWHDTITNTYVIDSIGIENKESKP
jgi:uncharacterized RDD family membrane protein YckC